MSLCRLIYCSQAIPELTYADLKDIMEKSEKNNTPVGITGMLCYGNSMFLQILEGDRKHVSRTYSRIANDKRHFNTELIDFSEVESRIFGEWSMKVVQLGAYSPEKVRNINMKYSTSTALDPVSMNAKQCLNFMIELRSLLN
ncbi:MAG: BLUF domain-containing protein [Xenococcaceae cyanobacterium]